MDSGITFGLMATLVVVGIVLAIAWVLMPLALFGTKPLLRQLIAETRRTNQLLESMTPSAPAAQRPSQQNNVPRPAYRWGAMDEPTPEKFRGSPNLPPT